MIDTDLHFAEDPDNLLCGKADVRTLCGQVRFAVTNWDASAVTCPRCLEVMEERATGTEKAPVPLNTWSGGTASETVRRLVKNRGRESS